MNCHRIVSLRDRRGNYTWLLVLSLPVIFGFGAVAIDLSYQKVVRAELQAAADIAVAAGAEQLDGTAEGLDRATEAAIRAAARNSAHRSSVTLAEQNIVFGYWDKERRSFVDSTDPAEVDALRLWIRRDDIDTTFASFAFADPEVGAEGRSAALQPPDSPAGMMSCYLPLAVPECTFDTHSKAQLASMTFKLNPAGIDNVGWARVDGAPNADWVRDQIRDCGQDGAARVGEQVYLNNGVLTTDLREIATAIKDSDSDWNSSVWGALPAKHSGSAVPTSYYGNTWEGPIIVFDGGPEYCQGMGGPYNGNETIVGFAWASVYDVRASGPAAEKNIWLRLDPMTQRPIARKGGGRVDGGVMFDEPVALVK